MNTNIKIRKHYKNQYTTIDNKLINDMSLSFKAKGVFLYFWSKPDDWDIKPKAIEEDWKDGQAVVYSALKELETLGYLKRNRFYINGKVAGINYHLSDTQEFNQENLNQENLNQENLNQENLNEYIYIQKKDITKERYNKKKDITKEPTSEEFSVVQIEDDQVLENYKQKFTKEENEIIEKYIKLRKEHHKSAVKSTIKALSAIYKSVLRLKQANIPINVILQKLDRNGCVYQKVHEPSVYANIKNTKNNNSKNLNQDYQDVMAMNDYFSDICKK